MILYPFTVNFLWIYSGTAKIRLLFWTWLGIWSDHDGTKNAAWPVIKLDIVQRSWSTGSQNESCQKSRLSTAFAVLRLNPECSKYDVCEDVIYLWQCRRLNQFLRATWKLQKDKIEDGFMFQLSMADFEVGPARTCPYELQRLRVARRIMVIIFKACKGL